jgi:hypothetical protein
VKGPSYCTIATFAFVAALSKSLRAFICSQLAPSDLLNSCIPSRAPLRLGHAVGCGHEGASTSPRGPLNAFLTSSSLTGHEVEADRATDVEAELRRAPILSGLAHIFCIEIERAASVKAEVD